MTREQEQSSRERIGILQYATIKIGLPRAKAWMAKPNKTLGGKTPDAALQAGDIGAVRQAAAKLGK